MIYKKGGDSVKSMTNMEKLKFFVDLAIIKIETPEKIDEKIQSVASNQLEFNQIKHWVNNNVVNVAEKK